MWKGLLVAVGGAVAFSVGITLFEFFLSDEKLAKIWRPIGRTVSKFLRLKAGKRKGEGVEFQVQRVIRVSMREFFGGLDEDD